MKFKDYLSLLRGKSGLTSRVKLSKVND
jgi:hypothetical protein